MEENKQAEEVVVPNEVEPDISKHMLDFNYLITTVMDYYLAKSGFTTDEEGESWKKGTKYEKVPEITPEVNLAVERAFIKQLKKFS